MKYSVVNKMIVMRAFVFFLLTFMGYGAVSPFPLKNTNDVVCWFSFDEVYGTNGVKKGQPSYEFVVNEIGNTNCIIFGTTFSSKSLGFNPLKSNYVIFPTKMMEDQNKLVIPSISNSGKFSFHITYISDLKWHSTNEIFVFKLLDENKNCFFGLKLMEESPLCEIPSWPLVHFHSGNPATNEFRILLFDNEGYYQTNSFSTSNVNGSPCKYFQFGMKNTEEYWVCINGEKFSFINNKLHTIPPSYGYDFSIGGNENYFVRKGLKRMDNIIIFDTEISDDDIVSLNKPFPWKILPPLIPNTVTPFGYSRIVYVRIQTGEPWRKFVVYECTDLQKNTWRSINGGNEFGFFNPLGSIMGLNWMAVNRYQGYYKASVD